MGWELVKRHSYFDAWVYGGKAEECRFAFRTPPEEIPGVRDIIEKITPKMAEALAEFGGVPIKYELWADFQPVAWADWYCIVVAHGSPLPWYAILILCLALLAAAVGFAAGMLRLLFHEVKDIWWAPYVLIPVSIGAATGGIAAAIKAAKRRG